MLELTQQSLAFQQERSQLTDMLHAQHASMQQLVEETQTQEAALQGLSQHAQEADQQVRQITRNETKSKGKNSKQKKEKVFVDRHVWEASDKLWRPFSAFHHDADHNRIKLFQVTAPQTLLGTCHNTYLLCVFATLQHSTLIKSLRGRTQCLSQTQQCNFMTYVHLCVCSIAVGNVAACCPALQLCSIFW